MSVPLPTVVTFIPTIMETGAKIREVLIGKWHNHKGSPGKVRRLLKPVFKGVFEFPHPTEKAELWRSIVLSVGMWVNPFHGGF